MFGGINTSAPNKQSLFGNSGASSSKTNTFSQPYQQQQQQLQQVQPTQGLPLQSSIFQNPGQAIQQMKSPSRFEKYELKGVSVPKLFASDVKTGASHSDTNDPSKSKHRKRTIPSHLVKRLNKNKSTLDEEDKPSVPILPFKATKQSQTDTFDEDFAYLYEHDKLPSRSLLDPLTFHDEYTPGEILMEGSDFNKMTQEPFEFKNAFQRPNRSTISQKTTGKENRETKLPWSKTSNEMQIDDSDLSVKTELVPTDTKQTRSLTSEKLYCAVIVYGFDDENFRVLIEHFAKYGKIMEDLMISDFNYYYGQPGNVLAVDKLVDINDRSNAKLGNKNAFPIFLGEGWVKITYDNPNSAIRALADNLISDNNGNILGVIPYTREDLELLLGQKISDSMDVGAGLKGLNHELELDIKLADNYIGRYLRAARNGLTRKDSNSGDLRSKSLAIKDGSNLLLKKDKHENRKTIWNSGMGFLFGKGEI